MEAATAPTPQDRQEGLSPDDENAAHFWRSSQRQTAENMETTGYRVAMAEKAGILAVTQHEKTIEGHKEELRYFEDQAKQHYEANPEAYQETARREAEAEGHKINR